MTSTFVILLTTVPADADATPLARALVDERLAACVNISEPMTSVYRWKGDVQADRERQLVIKTRADRVEALRDRLLALHPYDVPELLVLPVTGGSDAYLAWLSESTTILPDDER
jgi:periplasmic divalent cation tolerance protein